MRSPGIGSCTLALIAAGLVSVATDAQAQAPIKSCDAAGIGSIALTADGGKPTITSVSTGTANTRGSTGAGVGYCW